MLMLLLTLVDIPTDSQSRISRSVVWLPAMKAHSSPDAHMDKQRTPLILRGQIISLRDIGLSIRAIAHQLGLFPTRRPRSRVITTQEHERIRQAAEENPFTNAVAIRDELQLNVSNETVRRRLHEAGIHHSAARVLNNLRTSVIAKLLDGNFFTLVSDSNHKASIVPASKERLIDQHRDARIAFALEGFDDKKFRGKMDGL
ncbi:putative Transposase-containing protein 1 [Homarus americanus]|uniref:Putative Transposase-containing protein 1 n=1 Tax=Homarus americanus TaxID=6706 RepID=A0A8J5K3J9_HOMAM|nr:putative Transposase-containing protein 1 [Homarus americanus]